MGNIRYQGLKRFAHNRLGCPTFDTSRMNQCPRMDRSRYVSGHQSKSFTLKLLLIRIAQIENSAPSVLLRETCAKEQYSGTTSNPRK